MRQEHLNSVLSVGLSSCNTFSRLIVILIVCLKLEPQGLKNERARLFGKIRILGKITKKGLKRPKT